MQSSGQSESLPVWRRRRQLALLQRVDRRQKAAPAARRFATTALLKLAPAQLGAGRGGLFLLASSRRKARGSNQVGGVYKIIRPSQRRRARALAKRR